jgi:hypothetical protein
MRELEGVGAANRAIIMCGVFTGLRRGGARRSGPGPWPLAQITD